MRKKFLVFLTLIFVLGSCTAQTDGGTLLQNSYVSDSDANRNLTDASDNSRPEHSAADMSNEISDIALDLDSNIGDFNHTVLYLTVVGADLPYYAQFGEKSYTTIYKDGEFGTACIKDGKEIAFYPDITNVYEKDGTLYGVLSEGESYIDTKRFYGKITPDGTFEKLFDCWNVFYSNDKMYFHDNTSKANDDGLVLTNICSVNIDGSGKQTVSADVPVSIPYDRIFCYKDYLIYQGNDDDVFVMSADGTINKVVDGSKAVCDIEFVNDGFVYYTELVSEISNVQEETHTDYSLWRVGLNGENREQLLFENVISSPSNCFEAVAFSGKLLLFLPEGVRVYTDSMSNCATHEYERFSYDEIMQISVCNGQLCIVGNKKDSRNHQTLVYDSKGNVTFEYGF